MMHAFSRAIRRATNARNFMFAVGIFCFTNVGLMLLQNQLKQISPDSETKGGPQLHPALDYRQEGYTAADVEFVLRSYGEEGRLRYAMFEALDLGAFMWSYAAVLSMMLSVAASVAPYELLKLTNLLPWAAAAADAVENILMLTMLATYPQYVSAVAPYIVTASATKWQLLRAAASTVAGVGLYCMVLGAKQSLQPNARSRGGQGQQPTPQPKKGKRQR